MAAFTATLSFTRFSRAFSVILVAVAAVAIANTARRFSGTVDEPAHIAAGVQWLSTGRYDYDVQHPPLGRLAAAAGPYLRGARTVGEPAVFDEGARILGTGAQYVDTLAAARHGELVFFILLAAVVWTWARELTSDTGAAVATLLLVSNPTVLAHAGLATTDISCAATTTLALFLAVRWVRQPTRWRSGLFGLGAGLAVSSRLSAIAFIGAAIVLCYMMRGFVTRQWKIDGLRNGTGVAEAISVGLAVCCLVIWASYRFAFGQVGAGGPPLPAPAFITGVKTFLLHGESGHPTFLLGTPSNRGWWYYFPVALLVKTPIPLMLAALLGLRAAWRRALQRDWGASVPLCAALAIVAVSLAVKVDLGVRLVLPVYPLLAIAGAIGVADAWSEVRTRVRRPLIIALLGCSILVAVRAFPDELSYFNLIAGNHPERILVDSNLDWGQDLYRLRDTIAARHISDTVLVAYFGTADLDAAGVPRARVLGLNEHRTGWVAASETYLAGEWVGGAYQWLLNYQPVARIGPSMRLWYIPPSETLSTTRSLPH